MGETRNEPTSGPVNRSGQVDVKWWRTHHGTFLIGVSVGMWMMLAFMFVLGVLPQ